MANIKTDKYFSREIAEGIKKYLDTQSSNVKESTKFEIRETDSLYLVEVSYDLNYINTLLYVTFNAGKYNEERKRKEREQRDAV